MSPIVAEGRRDVLHCVADPNNVLRPVGRDSARLANNIGVQPPTWQFAVIAAANQNLQLVGDVRAGRNRPSSSYAHTLPAGG